VTSEQVLEPTYTPNEVSKRLKCSADFVRNIFSDEPGVIILDPGRKGRRRPYRTMRIPESVLLRVLRRVSNQAAGR
jgi:hypothetical protein